MDETTQNRTSDAAATRKRRSSILKNQRTTRTPFSELEFHVATPTDTSKSRRVSFSRRTGVAEFATNEATTTWKNFYEEHNKSLESSGNDSSANTSKQSLGQIGKRIFDQQFEEVDAVDFMGSLNPGYNINSSISNINFAQLTSIECTNDIKLTAPQTNFELSTFTNNHSKLFNNDISVPVMGEMSERIDINFSAVQKIGENDDLDEIQNDFQNQGNVICHGPFRDGQNHSEYIEIDLNSTHAVLRNDQSDMSITDTIHSPKVQEVSKSISIEKIVNRDWETDKENIAVNPYVTPKESVNFAVNDEPDKVLVFDGKRLTIQSENVLIKPITRHIITPAQKELSKAAQRKTIVLNVNDDLPNFINDPTNASGYLSIAQLKKHTELDSSMSITNPIAKIDQIQRQNTVLYDNDVGDISLTQAITSNIVKEKRRTIVFEDGTSNISITQAMPTNIIDKIEKSRTIHETDTGNISITQALPTNEMGNTVVYENEDCDISMTQALPNIVISVKSSAKSCTSEDGSGNMSVTQAVSSNIIIEKNVQEMRKTVLLEKDINNLSITQAVPASLIYTHNPTHVPVDSKQTNLLSDNEINRRRTVVFEDNAGNLSITEAVSSHIISNLKQEDKRKTIVFNDEEADISMTEAIPMNKLISFTNEEKDKVFNYTDKRNTTVFKNEQAELSVTQAIDQTISECKNTISKDMPNNECTQKRRTIVFDDENADISMTQVVDAKRIIPEAMNRIKNSTLHGNVVNEADVSMSEIVSSTQEQGKCIIFEDNLSLVHEKPTPHVAPNKSNINEILDISIDADVKKNTQGSVMLKEFNRTTYDREAPDNEIDIPEGASISKPIPHNLSQIRDDIIEKSLKQYYKAAKNELLDHTANVSQVLVYQMSQSAQRMHKGIEKHDSEIKPPMTALSDEGGASDDTNIENVKENKEPVVETVQSVTKIKDVDFTIDDKNFSSLLEIEINSKPSLSSTNKNDKMQMRYSESSPQEAVVSQVISKQSLKANVPDVTMCNSSFKPEVKKKESILDDLLDMSTSSLVEITTDQSKVQPYIKQKESVVSGNKVEVMVQTTNECYSEQSIQVSKQASVVSGMNEEESSNDMFYITKDGNEELPHIKHVSPLPLEFKEEKPLVDKLQRKLAHLKSVFSGGVHKNKNKKEDNRSVAKDKSIAKNLSKCSKNFKLADDTNELLDMLSDLTDKSTSRMVDTNLEVEEEKPKPLLIKGHLALENKNEMETEPRRSNFASGRRSIVLSREDILNNISMAGAALQKSRLELDESDSTDETTKESPNIKTSTKKTVRLSQEVVKTLQFDDTVSEMSDSNVQVSPLKKTAFGETSYMTENRSNVIPSYMRDVSDGIKELMDDLVKPMADNIPFDAAGTYDRTRKKTTSTCSMEVQANLLTSSQIDLDTELYSNCESMNEIPKISSAYIIKPVVRNSMTQSFKSPIKSVTIMTPGSEKSMDLMIASRSASPDRVIIFDHWNPLNNIILPPPEQKHIHKYNPGRSTDTLCTFGQSQSQSAEVVSTQMNVENLINYPRRANVSNTESNSSRLSKPIFIDQSENTQNDLEDREVNTMIAMKGNRELLEASSSLTLVDDAFNEISNAPEKKHSPVRFIYKLHEGELPEKDSDFNSNDELKNCQTKGKKRTYSPAKVDKHRHCTVSCLDVTPNPLTKMQKNTENSFIDIIEKPTKLKADKDETEIKMLSPTRREVHRAPSSKQESKLSTSPARKNKRNDRSKTNITVQQVTTDFKMNEKYQETLEPINEALNIEMSSSEPQPVSISSSDMETVDMVSSFTSSKNLGRDDQSVVTSLGEHHLSDDCSGIEWQDNDEFTRNVSDCDSSVNIVAKIDMLPFMGSHECEWESSIGDTWTFRLLHSCLRLSVRLQHRHENATRTCVRADTPVLSSLVETVHTEKKNPIAVLCVRFACEAMRYELSQGCEKAGAVPALVRRCAAVARLAMRWARAMHDTRFRLAYSLTADGILAVKVANIPLRSVWEVRMKIDLVVSEAGSAPFPRATPLAVMRVLAERHVHVRELAHLVHDVPHDWGHAPRTIWRIFKYLKHKKREDEFLELNY